MKNVTYSKNTKEQLVEHSLTFCVPVFNFDVAPLINDLHQQILQTDYQCNIVLIDDYSADEYRQNNRQLSKLERVIYTELPQNIGRAKIRNLFLEYTQSEHLIFLDCDSAIVRSDFVNKYVEEAKLKELIVCGGRIYESKPKMKSLMLHWKYGTFKESKNAEERSSNPNKSFMTNNFMISRKILTEIKFDERITKYGHEDTLFGYELLKNDITIKHIDNPVIHSDVEDCKQFLRKTEAGIENLAMISKMTDESFRNGVTLIKTFNKLQKYRLLLIVNLSFFILSPLLKKMLNNGFSSLLLFNIYKLGYFCKSYK